MRVVADILGRRVDFMGDPGGEPSDGLQLLHLKQPVLQLLLAGQVANDARKPSDAVDVGIAHGQLGEKRRAVFLPAVRFGARPDLFGLRLVHAS